MGLFSRRRPDPAAAARAQAEAIEDFWGWWRATGADEAARGVAPGRPEQATKALAQRVSAIHPDLAWELGPGRAGSSHLLVVSPEGDPALRAVARRWRLAAPPSDATWEYADNRLPAPDLEFTLDLGPARLDAVRVRLGARVEGPRVHVTVHHPVFADVPEPVRRSAAMLVLDAAVGETDVETWVGEIGTSTVEPLDAIPLVGLRAVVRHLREQYVDSDGEPTWVLLQGTADDKPLLATAQVPLLAVTAPQFDLHVAVAVPYTDVDEAGLPGPESLGELRGFEEHLRERLGRSGRLVAHQTSGGVRVLHFYVDGTTPAAAQLESAVSGWRQGRVQVGSQYDPAWDNVAHLRA